MLSATFNYEESAMKKNTREVLLDYLDSRSSAIALGCYDGISARIVENAGMPVAYLSGFCVAATMGKPDMGIISLQEMAARAKCITDSISIPLVADADNGYGGPVNIAETVRLFEDAGVAGLHQIGRAHVCTPVTNAHLVCRSPPEKKKQNNI